MPHFIGSADRFTTATPGDSSANLALHPVVRPASILTPGAALTENSLR
jgi:hypothetical protein